MTRIAIVQCGSKKLSWSKARSHQGLKVSQNGHSIEAENLYIGDLFKKSLAHAYKTVGRNNTYIISSKYGLIRPWDLVRPYEQNDGDFQIEYYGGVGKLPKVNNVLEGLGIGKRLQYLKRELDEEQEDS